MAVQSSPSQQPLEDHLRMGQNVNTETLSMSAPYTIIKVPQNSGDLYFTGFNDDASSITGFYFEANQPSNWDSPRHNFVIDNTNTLGLT